MKKAKKLVVLVYNDTLPKIRPYRASIDLEQSTKSLCKFVNLIRNYLINLLFDMNDNLLNCVNSRVVIQVDGNKISEKSFTFWGRHSFLINMNGLCSEIESEVEEWLSNELR